MRAVQIEEFGGPEVLKVAELATPEANAGELLVKVSRAGINFADTHQRQNDYLAKFELPLIPGAEVAGTVERDGPGGVVYVIEDWFARVAPGTDPAGVRAGDDADEARWVPLTDVADLPCVEGLLDALRSWHVLP